MDSDGFATRHARPVHRKVSFKKAQNVASLPYQLRLVTCSLFLTAVLWKPYSFASSFSIFAPGDVTGSKTSFVLAYKLLAKMTWEHIYASEYHDVEKVLQ